MANVKLPVAWFYKRQNGAGHLSFKDEEVQPPYEKIPLYTHTEWQSLSDDEIENLAHACNLLDDYPLKFTRAFEAKLKELNNGN